MAIRLEKYAHKAGRLFLALQLILMLSIPRAAAVPAKQTRIFLTGRDGTRFEARLYGDEHAHLLTTPDGCAIALSSLTGNYHYLRFTPEGKRELTAWRVLDPATPPEILQASRQIPRSEIAQEARLSRARVNGLRAETRSKAAADIRERHLLVLLVQFSDLSFQFTRDDFAARLSSDQPESATSYFQDQFAAAGTRFHIDVSEIITLSGKYAYYGQNGDDGKDIRPHLMILEACQAADPQIDFSRYDDDGDGTADNVFVFFAGGDEAAGAGDDHVWSHQWFLKDGAGINLLLDNVWINSYACSAEITPTEDGARMAGIGTFCHEYSHSLGLIDYYDTDYEDSGGESEALWRATALMDGGNWNDNGLCPPAYNALDRYMLGLCEPKALSLGEQVLPPVSENGDCFIMETDKEGEFFLFECRSDKGWDRAVGGKGLLIYHIDRSDNYAGNITAKSRWNRNQVNCVPEHQCIDLIEADPSVAALFLTARESGNLYDCIPRIFFPYDRQVSFTPDTNPGFFFWSGTASGLSLSDIRLDGDAVRFNVTDAAAERIPAVKEVSGEVFQDAAILSWSADNPAYQGPSWISWGEPGKESSEAEILPHSAGRYGFVIEGLTPRKAYSAKVYFKAGGSPVGIQTFNFTTKSRTDGAQPYIWLSVKGRNSDGSFPTGTHLPLRVYNVPDGVSVSWRFNGEAIVPGADGYFTPTKSGRLTAILHESDGSETLLQKTISLR